MPYSLYLAHIELCVQLQDLAIRWERLGIELGYTHSELMRKKRLLMGYCHNLLEVQDDLRFLQVLNSWVTGDPEKYKKEVLVKALETIRLANQTWRLSESESLHGRL
jgi:hypothetical protein